MFAYADRHAPNPSSFGFLEAPPASLQARPPIPLGMAMPGTSTPWLAQLAPSSAVLVPPVMLVLSSGLTRDQMGQPSAPPPVRNQEGCTSTSSVSAPDKASPMLSLPIQVRTTSPTSTSSGLMSSTSSSPSSPDQEHSASRASMLP